MQDLLRTLLEIADDALDPSGVGDDHREALVTIQTALERALGVAA